MMLNETHEEMLERVVGSVPATAVVPADQRDMAFGGAYEGASQFDKAFALWSPALQSADGELLPEKPMLDARVRDLMRNDGNAQTGQMLARDRIVGSMYILNAQPEYTVLKQSEAWASEFQEEVESKFMLAAESLNNWFDAAGTNTLTDMVRLGVGCFTVGGEVLIKSDWIREPYRPFKTAVQFIDTDRLSTPFDKVGMQGERIRGGVHQNARGKPLGYYIRNAHPADHDRYMEQYSWTYVRARAYGGSLNVLHLKEQMRVDQTRGVALFAAALAETQILRKFRRVTLQQAVVAATYAASIESDLPSEAVFGQLGANNTMSAGAAAASYAADYLAAIRRYTSKSKGMMVDGVRIPHFFPGTKLNLKQVGAPGGVGQDFEQSIIRHIAAILGVSYEELSRDFSKTNYSSARAAFVLTWQRMQAVKKQIADKIANWVYQLWFEEMLNTFQLETVTASMPNFYEGLNREAYCSATWIGAARGQIDELKETQAAVLRIKYCLSTHEDELAKLGKDWRKVYAQLSREKKERAARDIELVEDNMQNAISGDPRESETGGEAGDGDKKTDG